jgi:hypothetical protein
MKIKTLLYCTKAKPILVKNVDGTYTTTPNLLPFDTPLNGKIACECEVDTEEIIARAYRDYYCTSINHIGDNELMKRSCLTSTQLLNYLGSIDEDDYYVFEKKVGNALHLSNVKDRVMELSDVCKYDFWASKMFGISATEKDLYEPLEKAPQNMMWVYVKENGKWEERLLISVRPQWLCKILNGEKDIEVRRKVLKGMVE